MPGITEASAGTGVTSSAVRTPVQTESRLVMEVLYVRSWLAGGNPGGVDADHAGTRRSTLTTKDPNGVIGFPSDASVIDLFLGDLNQQFAESTETGGAGSAITGYQYTPLHDGNGKGQLVAATEFFQTVDGQVSQSVLRADHRVGYRLVRVSAEELLGLIAQFLQS